MFLCWNCGHSFIHQSAACPKCASGDIEQLSMTPTEILATRKRKGWSQQALADALGVSVRTVKHWEAGTRNMSAPTAKLLRLISQD